MNYGDVDAYKYLGVLEGDEIKHTQMKRRIEEEYFRRDGDVVYAQTFKVLTLKNPIKLLEMYWISRDSLQ